MGRNLAPLSSGGWPGSPLPDPHSFCRREPLEKRQV
ncbi:hypothetical protein ABID74_002166 [Gordonia terrae]